MKAQASRGVDFKESKFKEKVVQIISLLIPVFVISFKRAEDLGNAMEVRGYVIGAKRSKIDEYKIGFLDISTLVISFIILAIIIVVKSI
jgi:energy-coupling factor transport system permease protein